MSFHFVSINGQPVTKESNEDSAANNHEEEPSISIWDTSFHRGDGVFEVMRLLRNGDIRGLDHHLTRLQTSAAAVGCPLPELKTIERWLKEAAQAATSSPLNKDNDKPSTGEGSPADGCLRLIATKGGGPGPHDRVVPSVIISWSPLPPWPPTFSLFPLIAPWHPAGFPGWDTPIKWTSYGPNVVSTQKAKEQGFTDAILLSSSRLTDSFGANIEDCHVLDGPNFAISWIKGNTLYLPDTKALGLLPSITQDLLRRLAEETLGMTVEYGIYTLKQLLDADEVYISSTTRGLIPIEAIGDHTYSVERPRIKRLQALLDEVNHGS
jgi:branched-subunit amino acid aminotransferase/4-amino-4-deoxychorismate lyase